MSTSDRGTPDDRGVLGQLSAIAQEGQELLRLELKLARQETTEKLAAAAQSSGLAVGGGLLVAVGSIYLVAAIGHALALLMPRWLASLIVGTCLLAGGMSLVQHGMRDIQTVDLTLEKTITSVREDTAWLLRQIKSRLT